TAVPQTNAFGVIAPYFRQKSTYFSFALATFHESAFSNIDDSSGAEYVSVLAAGKSRETTQRCTIGKRSICKDCGPSRYNRVLEQQLYQKEAGKRNCSRPCFRQSGSGHFNHLPCHK